MNNINNINNMNNINNNINNSDVEMVDATVQREAEAFALAKKGFAEQKARILERQNALMLLQISPASRSNDRAEFLEFQSEVNRAVEILATEDTNFKVMKDSLLQMYPHEPLFGGGGSQSQW
jgi:hypothetical protein